MMIIVQFELPDELAKIAQAAGMLTPLALEQFIQDAIKRQQLKVAAQPIDDEQGHPKYGLLFGMWRDRAATSTAK
jgi:hypothetical protein